MHGCPVGERPPPLRRHGLPRQAAQGPPADRLPAAAAKGRGPALPPTRRAAAAPPAAELTLTLTRTLPPSSACLAAGSLPRPPSLAGHAAALGAQRAHTHQGRRLLGRARRAEQGLPRQRAKPPDQRRGAANPRVAPPITPAHGPLTGTPAVAQPQVRRIAEFFGPLKGFHLLTDAADARNKGTAPHRPPLPPPPPQPRPRRRLHSRRRHAQHHPQRVRTLGGSNHRHILPLASPLLLTPRHES